MRTRCLVQVGNGIELDTVGSLFEPYLWRPCGVTWDIVPEQQWSLLTVTVMLVRLYSWQLLPRAVTLPWLSEAGQ